MNAAELSQESRRVIEGVLEQHSDDSAILWCIRERAVDEPHYALKDLLRLDNRVEAHCDGLRIGGRTAWTMCAQKLKAFPEVGEGFVAARLALEMRDASFEQVMEMVEASPEIGRGVAGALSWIASEEAKARVAMMLEGNSAARQRVAAEVLGANRWNENEMLSRALAIEDPDVRKRATLAIGELGRVDQVREIQVNEAKHRDTPEAAWSSVLLGRGEAVDRLRNHVETAATPLLKDALALAARSGDPGSQMSWHRRVAAGPEKTGMAIRIAGHVGDPTLMPWIMDQMRVPKFSRIAGEAFTMITGIGLAYRDLEHRGKEDREDAVSDSGHEGDDELDADENLAIPDGDRVRAWWERHRTSLKEGTRYLAGRPIADVEWLGAVLRNGFQRQRAAAAIELTLKQPGRALFNVRARGSHQVGILGRPDPPIR